jgi:hypothetical protein
MNQNLCVISAVKDLCSLYEIEIFLKCSLEATGKSFKLLGFVFQRLYIPTDI